MLYFSAITSCSFLKHNI